MSKRTYDPVFNSADNADAPVEEVPTPEPAPEPIPEPAPDPTPEPAQVSVVANDSTSVNVNSAPVPANPTPNDAVSDIQVQPEYSNVPTNAKAEPANAGVAHEATPEQVNETQQ